MQSADVIEVQFGALEQAAAALSEKARVLGTHIEQLSAQLQPLRQTWSASGSSAGQAAEESETRLRAAINDVIGVINQFGVKVDEAREMQIALENRNTALFS